MNNVLFLIVVFLTNIVQCITGFAGTVLAMPFSVMLVGYDTAKPVLNLLGLLASVYVVAVCFKSINKRLLFKMTAFMLFGMAAGMFLKRYIAGNPTLLYRLLGTIVIVFAVLNAVRFYAHKDDIRLPTPVSLILLLTAGVVHGLFVCGGPLLVTYAGEKIKDKNEFRGTLSAAWIILNGIMFVTDIVEGSFTLPVIKISLVSALVLVFALIIGNLLSKKMSRALFLQITYVLMLISGVSLFFK